MQPIVRRNHTARTAQVHAIDLVAHVAMKQQKHYVAGMLGLQSDQEQPQAFRVGQIVALSWQWDETSQRMKTLIPNTVMRGEVLRSGGVQVQVIGQHGRAQMYFTRTSEVTDSQPFICQPMLIAEQTVDGILEAL